MLFAIILLNVSLFLQVINCLPQLCQLLTHTYSAVRHMAARCIGALAALSSFPVMEQVVARVLPLLGAVHHDTYRQGAMEAIMCIIERLQTNIIPYVVILIVPLLGLYINKLAETNFKPCDEKYIIGNI